MTQERRKHATVLLVEDDASDAAYIERLLSKSGPFHVEHQSTLAAGLGWLSDNSVDVVLLDYNLPDSSGFDSLSQIHERAPRVPVVMLSGSLENELATALVREGAISYLAKRDLQESELMHAVRLAMAQSGMSNAGSSDRPVGMTTDLGLLLGTQEYLKSLLGCISPESVLIESWERFYDLYSEMIRRFALSRGVPELSLDDCVQEVWSAVVMELPRMEFDPNRGRFRTWLFTLVRNKAADLIRRRSRNKTESLEQASNQHLESDPDDNPSSALERRWNQQLVWAVLPELCEKVGELNYRVFHMRRIDEQSVSEVAEALDITPDQVRYRHHRAQKRFADLLMLYAGEDLGPRTY